LSEASGFTMVEIALSIAVVSFALVAILGVLPTGMRVQRDNREETIINQDGSFWLEAIRSGSIGMDDLTNYVDQIRVRSQVRQVITTNIYTFGANYRNGRDIVGLLSTPRYTLNRKREWVTNTVFAFCRALSGMAAEKPDGSRTTNTDFAFTYRLTAELHPFQALGYDQTNFTAYKGTEYTSRSNLFLKAANLSANFQELRLTVDWPVYPVGKDRRVGRNRRVFRTLVSGSIVVTNAPVETRITEKLYFVQPSTFVMAQ